LSEMPRRVEKPWGHELWWGAHERYVGKLLHVRKGESLSLQYHRSRTRRSSSTRGGCSSRPRPAGEQVELRRVELGPGEAFHITPGTVHRMTGLEDTDVFEVSTPELDDVVRLEDRLRPQGTSAP